jgi:hypothetical protein
LKTIKINCESNKYLNLEELNSFQGDLKDLMEIDYQRLKKDIITNGFVDPFNVWFYDSKWFILDGHQRVRVLTKMKSEGYTIPELPVTVVKAETYKQAKQIVLSLSSNYGTMTTQGLYEFVQTAGLNYDDLNNYRLPEINLDKFAEEFGVLSETKNFEPATAEEQGKLDEKILKKCPACNHEF